MLYCLQVIEMFRGCKQEDMPPHIYASAQTTYRNMLATNADQSLVLMGPTGAGKSVNCAHLLHYFCSTSVSPQSSLTGEWQSISFSRCSLFLSWLALAAVRLSFKLKLEEEHAVCVAGFQKYFDRVKKACGCCDGEEPSIKCMLYVVQLGLKFVEWGINKI